MTRGWLILCGAAVVAMSFAATASSQERTTLADRIQQLRRGWSADDAQEDEAPTTPRVPTTTSRQPAPTQRAPSTPASTTGRGGLPQIDARALLPSNLFSRSADLSNDDEQPLASAPRRLADPVPTPRVGSAIPVAPPTPRAGTTHVPGPSVDGFTLPGLGSSASAASRADGGRTSATSRSSANSPPTTGAASATPVRQSPQHRPPMHVDLDAMRGERPRSTSNPNSSPTSTESDVTSADRGARPAAEQEPFATGRSQGPSPAAGDGETPSNSPTVASPIVLPTEPSRTQRMSDDDRGASGPTLSFGGDRSDQPAATADQSPRLPSDAPSAAAGNSTVTTLNAGSAAKAFESRLDPRATTSPGPPQLSPFAPRISESPTSDAMREHFTAAGPTLSTGPSPTAVLVTNYAPAIASDIQGPRQIVIGREASYSIRLRNTGSTAAEELVARISVPSWAEIGQTSATLGTVRQGEHTGASETLEWHIPRLDAEAAESLTVNLTPRASRPLEFGVTWTHAPIKTRTVVEVQEPKLDMQVSGPDDVLFGKSHVYCLTISNPGTGVAENVRIELLPPGTGKGATSSHQLGILPAGTSKTVDVELTAREAGKLRVQAVATADGGLTAQAAKYLFCRKPELEVDWRGPAMQYAGTTATYFFRVRNPGTAAAEDVVVRVVLPVGAELVSASEGFVQRRDEGDVLWRVGSLGPGDDGYMELSCIVHSPGQNRLRVSAATVAGDLADEKLAATDVVALADLTLTVKDPPGPVLVGDEAVYEIRVTNRGASAAEDVNVIGLFSAGLEPDAVDGAPYAVTDGRVSFRTIRKLPAGQNIVLQIRARAATPGTHVFRAEVLCRDLEIKLAAEETTRFYVNDIAHDRPTAQTAVDAGQTAQFNK